MFLSINKAQPILGNHDNDDVLNLIFFFISRHQSSCKAHLHHKTMIVHHNRAKIDHRLNNKNVYMASAIYILDDRQNSICGHLIKLIVMQTHSYGIHNFFLFAIEH